MVGKIGTAKTTVSDKNTAKTVGSGSLNVFSTPMMIALMEEAACDALADSLESGQTSVGTKVNILHLAASTLGKEITASATVDSVDGKKVSFTVQAFDGDTEIGKGTHDRFIVDAEKFMNKLEGR